MLNFILPTLLIGTLYFTFYLEIAHYWRQAYSDSLLQIKDDGNGGSGNIYNENMPHYQTLWIINYTLFFLAALSFLNITKLKNRTLGGINLGLNIFAVILFLVVGLVALGQLRENFLSDDKMNYFFHNSFNIGLRYVSYTFLTFILIAIHRYFQQAFLEPLPLKKRLTFDLIIYSTILWVASTELITWMEIMRIPNIFKFGLSILWGSFALILIVIGIWKKKKHLRIGGIVLFAITLVKLLFYDLEYLNTLAKTIIFVSLGVLLLVISFLYNKYKHLINDDEVE
jgi:uncharacterized membrane protein SirB2